MSKWYGERLVPGPRGSGLPSWPQSPHPVQTKSKPPVLRSPTVSKSKHFQKQHKVKEGGYKGDASMPYVQNFGNTAPSRGRTALPPVLGGNGERQENCNLPPQPQQTPLALGSSSSCLEAHLIAQDVFHTVRLCKREKITK